MENFILSFLLCVQEKLGEKNKFYYDENLKHWVEEGATQPPEEAVLSSPPINTANANISESSYNIGNSQWPNHS